MYTTIQLCALCVRTYGCISCVMARSCYGAPINLLLLYLSHTHYHTHTQRLPSTYCCAIHLTPHVTYKIQHVKTHTHTYLLKYAHTHRHTLTRIHTDEHWHTRTHAQNEKPIMCLSGPPSLLIDCAPSMATPVESSYGKCQQATLSIHQTRPLLRAPWWARPSHVFFLFVFFC